MSYSKYRAKRVEVGGIMFDSKLEARRYQELKALEESGEISYLTLQPEFELIPRFKKNGKTYRKAVYRADFSYHELGSNKTIVEDCKGFKTDVYKLKKKLFEYRYPELEIVEVTR